GVATVAAAATTVPLRVKNLRRSIALFPSRRRSPPTPRELQHIEPAAMSQLPCAVAHRPAAVSFGSFTSFPLSRRVRFAPRADVPANARVYEYTPFCNGPGDVKSPRVIVASPSSRFCPWSTLRPPHCAVRGSGEPI